MERTVLTVNTGSSSVRIVAFTITDRSDSLTRVAESHLDRAAMGATAPNVLLRRFLEGDDAANERQFAARSIVAVAHRIVHGGASLVAPRIVDAETEASLRALIPLAPLHMPVALEWIDASRAVLGDDIPQAAVFDTAFFATLPDVAAHYAIPRRLARAHGVRRFGFHGLAHESMASRWRELRPDLRDGGRLISIQLGAGCSIAAIAGGQPRDISMGFSPLEGLVMATRAGDVDAGLVTYLMREAHIDPAALDHVLNNESGLFGLSGISADLREVLASDTADARLAVDLYVYRLRKYVGAYLAALDGADGIVFGGGVGEHAPEIRDRVLSGMSWCGIEMDRVRNGLARGGEMRIAADGSAIDAWVLAVDEAALLARKALEMLDPSCAES